MKQQHGFTLIELVFVIVILGVLAALAVPRFVDLTGDAKVAALRGMAGAVRSASAIVHAAALTQQKDRNATDTVTAEGDSIAIVFGYPAASATGIVAAVQSLDNFDTPTHAAGVTTFKIANAPATCSFTYTQAALGTDAEVSIAANPVC